MLKKKNKAIQKLRLKLKLFKMSEVLAEKQKSLILGNRLAMLPGTKRNVWVWRPVYQATRITSVVVNACNAGRAFGSVDWQHEKGVHEKVKFLSSVPYRVIPPLPPHTMPCPKMAVKSWNVLPTGAEVWGWNWDTISPFAIRILLDQWTSFTAYECVTERKVLCLET